MSNNEGTLIKKDITTEVHETRRTEEELLKFANLMRNKLHKHAFDVPPFYEADINLNNMIMSIQRCLLDGDFISVANYAMIANYTVIENSMNPKPLMSTGKIRSQ